MIEKTKTQKSEVMSFAKDTRPWFLTSFRIVYVPPLTYKALQDVGASSRPTAPNPVICFLPLFLLLLCFNTDPQASLRFLQQDNHALISAPFAWNTHQLITYLLLHLILAQISHQRPSLLFLKWCFPLVSIPLPYIS